MNFEKLKTGILEIVALVQSVPQDFQQRAFEILLTALLTEVTERSPSENNDRKVGRTNIETDERKQKLGDDEEAPPVPMTTALRVLMQRAGIEEIHLRKLLFVADGQVHWLKEPTHGKLATGQAEWALLIALRSAILNNAATVDPEAVRSICQEKGYYDRANYATNFKTDKVKAYFKGAMVAQGDAQSLTPAGEKALADLVRELTGADK